MKKASRLMCDICGNKDTVHTVQIPYSGFTKETKDYNYFSCCNYFKQSSDFNKQKAKNLYQQDYFVNMYKTASILKRKLFLYLKAFTLRSYIENKKILEIGASTGEFLDVCRDFEPTEIMGLEISKEASMLAKKIYGFDFVTKNFESIEIKDKYNTIFMFHVIEHVKDPIVVIKKCLKLLKPGGFLIMETPNIDSLEYWFFSKKWVNWSTAEHTHLFSTKTFKSIAQKLRIKKGRYIYSPISNVMPTQVLNNTLVMQFYFLYLPFYALLYFIASVYGRSGVVTAIYQKK